MARIEKTVFISYRRTDVSFALAVYQYLASNGFDVFFDYTSISTGDFEQIIVTNIKARANFILILTPTSLDHSNEPGDWLRREIETAIDENRNIIPLFFDGFSFDSPSIAKKLTGKLGLLRRYNGLAVPSGYFTEAMERLRSKFQTESFDDVILHPAPAIAQKVVEEEQSAANKALQFRDDIIKELNETTEGKSKESNSTRTSKIPNINTQTVEPPQSKPEQVFISYSSEDVDFANQVNNDLLRHKINTWIDQLGIRSGDDWPTEIANAILESKIVLVIISPDALESKWVNRELSFADKKEKLVFPLIYKNCRIPHWFDLRFGNIQWADFTCDEYDRNLVRLLDSLKKILQNK